MAPVLFLGSHAIPSIKRQKKTPTPQNQAFSHPSGVNLKRTIKTGEGIGGYTIAFKREFVQKM